MSLTIRELRKHATGSGKLTRRLTRVTVRGLSWAMATDGHYMILLPSVHTRIPAAHIGRCAVEIGGALRKRGTVFAVRDLLTLCRRCMGGESWLRGAPLPGCGTAVLIGETLLNPHLVARAIGHARHETATLHSTGALDMVVFVGIDSTWVASVMPVRFATSRERLPPNPARPRTIPARPERRRPGGRGY